MLQRRLISRAALVPVVFGAVGLLTRCTSGPPPEPVGRNALPVVFTSVVEAAQRWAVKYQGTALNTDSSCEYTISAIGPQSAPAACTAGAFLHTHGPSQSLARSTLSCLDTPGSCPASAGTPVPNPVRWLGDTCSSCVSPPASCYTATQDAVHYLPEYYLSFTDAEAVRVGAHSFLHLGTGEHFFYYDAGDGNGCRLNWFSGQYKEFINYIIRSDDCGATWPTAGSYRNYQIFQWRDANMAGCNFDQPRLYVDPFNVSSSGNYYAYITGSVCGAFRGMTESGDVGDTWIRRGYVGDALGSAGKNDGFPHGGNMTSTADGTQFYAGCIGATLRLYYSYDRWATYSTYDPTWVGAAPNCGVIDTAEWPTGATQDHSYPYAVGISRIGRSNDYANYARVRIAYPTVVGSAPSRRQRYHMLEVGVQRKGLPAGTVQPYQSAILDDGGSALHVLEAGFTEMDPFDTPRGGVSGMDLPDTAVLWELVAGATNNTFQFRYRLVQGANTYSSARDLAASGWAFDPSARKKVGDYNRAGAYYYDKNTKRYNYLMVWPHGGTPASSSPQVEPHYNVVSVQPSINASTVNVEKLNFGTLASGPAVTSQGTNKLDIFWKDSNGNLTQKSYSNGWVAGTQSRGKPPGVSILKDPAVASWGSNRLDVFVRGTDEKLWQWWWDGVDRGWALIDNGPIKAPPSVTDAGNGVLYVFSLMADNSVRYRKYDQGWIPGWTSLGNAVVGAPVAINDGSTVHVFVRGADAHVWQKYTTDGGATWLGWFDLGGNLESNPAVSAWSAGRIDLFGRPTGAPEITLFHRAFEGGWQQSWQDLLTNRGASLDWVGDPDAVSMAAQRTDVFARSSDNLLWHVWHISPP